MLFSDDELLAKLSRDISVERDYGYDYNDAFADIYPLLRQAATRIEQLKEELADAKRWAMESRQKRWAAESRAVQLEEKHRIGTVFSQEQGNTCHG